VFEQLLAQLKHHGLFEQFQSAYRKCFSTETALVKVINNLLGASDSDQVSILAMLDMSAAFDTLDHDILTIDCLQHLAVRNAFAAGFGPTWLVVHRVSS
jgi:hypothetical protein